MLITFELGRNRFGDLEQHGWTHVAPVAGKSETLLSCKKKLDKVLELVGGGSVINGAYPIYFFFKC